MAGMVGPLTDRIDGIERLEAVVGRPPPAIALKVIDHLDATALRWIGTSPLMLAGFGEAGTIAITLAGDTAGFADADRATLRLPLAWTIPNRRERGLASVPSFSLPASARRCASTDVSRSLRTAWRDRSRGMLCSPRQGADPLRLLVG